MGAACGFSPDQVKAMSVWEFQAAVAGWIRANVPEDAGAASEAELDAIWDSMKEDGLVN